MKKKLWVLVSVPVLVLFAALAVFLTGSLHPRLDPTGESSGDMAPPTAADTGADTGGLKTSESKDAAGGSTTAAAATAPMTRAVISTGQVTIHTRSISRARAEVIRLVSSWDGIVADEQTTSDDHGRAVESTLTLRVPTAHFPEAMTAFADLGEVEQQSRKSEDVTTKVIDNDARVRAAERSIRQIEALLGRAEKLSDIISIESDLARRQADLDSLKSQQAYLADQTSQSTINVYLSLPSKAAPVQAETHGFLAGLSSGWTALGSATVVVLTLVGAVLPFAVLLLVLGVPIWLVVRRRLGAGAVSGGSAPARSA
jgi:hypothetical protein